LSKSGDESGARATLREYLEREPEGRWVVETRRALAALGESSGGDSDAGDASSGESSGG
jgi:hypothetical protein